MRLYTVIERYYKDPKVDPEISRGVLYGTTGSEAKVSIYLNKDCREVEYFFESYSESLVHYQVRKKKIEKYKNRRFAKWTTSLMFLKLLSSY